MIFSYTTHKGMAPKIAEQMLPEGYAVIAENCDLSSGELRPIKNSLLVGSLVSAVEIGTIYYYLGQYWFEFPSGTDIQEGPVANDTENRVYWTGNGLPKKTNSTEAVTGAGPYPTAFYPISVPTPDFAPTATLGAGGTGSARDVSYVWTVVTSWGEEGMPSEPSNEVAALQGQTVNLSGMTLVRANGTAYAINSWVFPATPNNCVYRCVTAGTSGAAPPTFGTTQDGDTTDGTVVWRCYKDDILNGAGAEKRIYRSNVGNTSASWRLVDTITITATTYTDTTADDALEATILPSEDWSPPPDAGAGLVAIGQSFAVFVGKDIFVSEPNRPHAWPYGYSVAHDIIGLAAIGNALLVLTKQNPVIFVGSHPDSMTPKTLAEPKKCLSKSGIVLGALNEKDVAMFPTINGIEVCDGIGTNLLTKDILDKDSWSGYEPQTIKGVFHRGRYYGFYYATLTLPLTFPANFSGNGGAVVFDTTSGDMTQLSIQPTAAYVDPESDTLYYTVWDSTTSTNSIYKFEGDATQPLPSMTYRYRKEVLTERIRPAYARVLFEKGDIADYIRWVEIRNAAITANQMIISEYGLSGCGGRIGGGFWFSVVPIAGVNSFITTITVNGVVYDITTVPVYAGVLELNLNIYRAGVLVKAIPVYDDKPFRTGIDTRGNDWQFELVGNVERVKRLDVAASVAEIMKKNTKKQFTAEMIE